VDNILAEQSAVQPVDSAAAGNILAEQSAVQPVDSAAAGNSLAERSAVQPVDSAAAGNILAERSAVQPVDSAAAKDVPAEYWVESLVQLARTSRGLAGLVSAETELGRQAVEIARHIQLTVVFAWVAWFEHGRVMPWS
jgi:hypothetical protein